MSIRHFVISADKVNDCLQAINDLHTMDFHYSWVNDPPSDGFENLVSAFDEWRYEAVLKDNGDVQVEYFTGEKLGHDNLLFDTIAPFVKEEAVIYCEGEDDCHWKWCFKNGKCKELSGTVVYEEE